MNNKYLITRYNLNNYIKNIAKLSEGNIKSKCYSSKFKKSYLTKRGKVAKSNSALNKEELISWNCPDCGASNTDHETLEIVECGSCKAKFEPKKLYIDLKRYNGGCVQQAEASQITLVEWYCYKCKKFNVTREDSQIDLVNWYSYKYDDELNINGRDNNVVVCTHCNEKYDVKNIEPSLARYKGVWISFTDFFAEMKG